MIQLLPLLLAATSHAIEPLDFIAATTLSLEQPAPSEEQPEVTDATLLEASPMTWGAKDSWRWSIQGAWAKDVKHSDNTLQTYGVEFDYFMEDDLSLDFGFAYMDVQQDGPNANGFNFTLQLRWHFIHKDTWSMFLEGGAGLLRTSENVPTGGSKFNFTPQAGVGFTFDVGNNNRIITGVKWHHISNANTYATNPGRDSIMVWGGMSFPF
ncbi:MAG: acyloxyacyl hydrolase [Phycisphaerae bacterium]|nr:acyloxyacyl hydrolase [Phycisphaerae bacterium]MBT5408819.1 acyloxyacyl hydrolase [Phycisphaerae bacterium]